MTAGQAPMVVLVEPASFEVVPFAMGSGGGVDSLTARQPAEDWQDVTRIVYDAFRDAYGADRVTLLTEAPPERLMEDRSPQPLTDWSDHAGSVLVTVWVSGRYEQRTMPSQFTPRLATMVRFWEIKPELYDFLYPIGAAAEAMGAVSADPIELGSGDDLPTIEDAMRAFSPANLRDDLEQVTRQEVDAYIAKVRAGG